jgi:hypothetical protein
MGSPIRSPDHAETNGYAIAGWGDESAYDENVTALDIARAPHEISWLNLAAALRDLAFRLPPG